MTILHIRIVRGDPDTKRVYGVDPNDRVHFSIKKSTPGGGNMVRLYQEDKLLGEYLTEEAAIKAMPHAVKA